MRQLPRRKVPNTERQWREAHTPVPVPVPALFASFVKYLPITLIGILRWNLKKSGRFHHLGNSILLLLLVAIRKPLIQKGGGLCSPAPANAYGPQYYFGTCNCLQLNSILAQIVRTNRNPIRTGNVRQSSDRFALYKSESPNLSRL